MLVFVFVVLAQVIVDQQLGTSNPNCTICNNFLLGREFHTALFESAYWFPVNSAQQQGYRTVTVRGGVHSIEVPWVPLRPIDIAGEAGVILFFRRSWR
jgi:hypothetical protein